MMSAPSFCSSFASVSLIALTLAASLSSVQPPPMTTPSSTAALVAFSASSTRSFFSFSSVSVCAPTWMIATPPERRAMRSLSFSRSYSCSVAATRLRICDTRAETSRCVEPSPTMVHASLVMSTLAAKPSTLSSALSSDTPSSSLTIVPPVRMAMSSRYDVLRSPKPGALTATTLRAPRSLLTTSVASASCSTSSAMMSSG
mmetsp:Transcript_25876/g.76648  ORF Transcript_25876/g.76648 Transcript_25876/m.76648 type:complete len:201 (+) Transcript_25876:847-1449(+)